MSDFAFRMMSGIMRLMDWLHPTVEKRSRRFGLREGMTVIDYGCGPGRYLPYYARLVGAGGSVYAVDVHPLAIEAAKRQMARHGLMNVTPVLAQGYATGLPGEVADAVIALDMFFGLQDPSAFLQEARRICKPGGYLILDDGHESRARTLQKVQASGLWKVVETSPDHIRCKKM